MNPGPRLRFVLLTEDTGKDADAVLRAVFRSVLRLLEPDLDSRAVSLDEVEQIKDREDLQCLKDQHNARLAKGFPYEAVYAANKSFTATVDLMLASPVLMESLASLRDT